jgi:copper chaperone CopZ
MSSENLKVYDLTVSKIRCTNCSKKIKSELGPIPGMKDVKVNVLAEKVIVTFDSNIW